jgi:hypothetical protein
MITRRRLLLKASQLAPLAVAAGMLGRVAVPVEQTVIPDAVPMQDAVVGWVEAEPVYSADSFVYTEGGWMFRGRQLWSEVQDVSHRITGGRSILLRSSRDGGVFRWGAGINSTVSEQLTKLFTPVMNFR